MTKKPHVDTRMAKHVERRVLELKPTKSQAEIAAEAGYATERVWLHFLRANNPVQAPKPTLRLVRMLIRICELRRE